MLKVFIYIIFLIFYYSTSAQEYDAELINLETNITFKKNNLLKTHTYELKINNRRGEKYSRITIPYSSIIEVDKIEARIINKNGEKIRDLKKNEISERSIISDFSFYEDNYVKEFSLRHNTYPYTIVYSYQIIEEEFLYLDNWIPAVDLEIPTHNATLNLIIPEEFSFSYISNLTTEPITTQNESQKVYTWKTSYSEIFKPEPLSPPILDFIPYLWLIPHEYIFEKEGSFRSWKDYGNWQYSILEGIEELPENEKSKIFNLVKDIDNKKEKIKTLFHYLQDETRYINVSIETGGLKPYPASYVATNKYGDCKALTNYFKSVLKLIGINSYYTKIHAGNPLKKINKEIPSQQFNHVILLVPLNSDSLYIDCTSNCAFNYTGTFIQDREAFLVDENNSYFIHTPKLTWDDVLESRKIRLSYENSNSIARYNCLYKGEIYETFMELMDSYSQSDHQKYVTNNLIEDGSELQNYNIVDFQRDKNAIQVSYETRSKNIYEFYNDDIVLRNIPFKLSVFDVAKERKIPVQIDYPVYKIDTLIYEIPSGYQISQKVNDTHLSTRFGEYKVLILNDKRQIKVIKKITINKGIYQKRDISDLHNFINEIRNSEINSFLSITKSLK